MAEQDLLTRILGEINERREGLREYVEEMPLLQRAALALNNHSPSPSNTKAVLPRRRGRPAKASTAASGTRRGPKRPTRAQAPAAPASRAAVPRKQKGANQHAVMGVLRAANDPMTARQVADAAGLEPSMAHSVLAKLTNRGDARLTKGPDGKKQYIAAAQNT